MLLRIAPELRWEVRIAGAICNPGKSPIMANGSGAGGGARSAWQLDHLEPTVLARYLASASIYAAPARYEPFGLGILEAALSGCALVLSDLPSLRENWTSAAIFVPPNDDAAWIKALNGLASDEEARVCLAKLAKERARCFTPDAMATRYLQVYRDLVPAPAVKQEVAA